MAAKTKRRRSKTSIALIPTIIAALPELTVGIAAAHDADSGKPSGEVGALALRRLGALYGQSPGEKVQVGPVEFKFDVQTNAIAKIGAVAVHLLARAGQIRIPLARGVTLL